MAEKKLSNLVRLPGCPSAISQATGRLISRQKLYQALIGGHIPGTHETLPGGGGRWHLDPKDFKLIAEKLTGGS